MSSARDPQTSTFPTVPPSLSAGVHGMRDYYAAQDTLRPAPHTLQEITPYLGLRARLSQVWINRWTILLLLILARTLLAITGLHHDLDSAKKEATSACTAVESMGSAMASMPHYLSSGVNELAASGVENAVNGLMSMLLLTVTGVEEMVVFFINMLTSTYLCLITLVVSGSLQVALKVVEDAAAFLNKTLGSITDDLDKGISDFTGDLNTFLGGLNSIPEIFGSSGKIPTINLNSSIDALSQVRLPTETLDEGLSKINDSIPTFAEVRNATDNIIRLPFEEVKKLLNETLNAFSFDRSMFPVPQKEQLSFCSDDDGISDFFDDLYALAGSARKIFIGVLLVAAILCCIPMAYQEIRRWRAIQQRAKLVSDSSRDPLDVIYITSRPYTAEAGIKLSSYARTTKTQNLLRWAVAYATTPAALFLLSLALAGLFSCLCQYILLRAIEKEVPALEQSVGAFADKVLRSLNNASVAWANGTNSAILDVNQDINRDIFGWVGTSTTALNDTLNAFVDETTKVLNDTFGGTILHDPIAEVFNCLIGLKIVGIVKGLTWVHDHAHVNFPLFPNDTFSLGAAASIASSNPKPDESFLADANSHAKDKISAAVKTVTNHIASGIRTEAIISTVVLLLWVVVVIMGLVRIAVVSMSRTRIRGEGGHTYAGDIGKQEFQERGGRDEYLMSEAPAYAPPTFAQATSQSNIARAFRQPMPGETSTDGPSRESTERSDGKLGFAGQRGTPVVDRPKEGHIRQSSYPVIVDEKR